MAERPDPDTDPNTLADRLDDLANDRRWDCWNQHGGGSLDVPEGYDPSPDCCDAADGANALRAAADGLRQLADENRALREQLDAAQLRSIEARNPGIDMDEVRRVRLAYPDPERHETVSRAKYGASLAPTSLPLLWLRGPRADHPHPNRRTNMAELCDPCRNGHHSRCAGEPTFALMCPCRWCKQWVDTHGPFSTPADTGAAAGRGVTDGDRNEGERT